MIDFNRQIIFIHIPKTGGLSIRKSLFNIPGNKYCHVKPNEFYHDLFFKKLNYFKFTFIRNPWDRFVSSYFYIKQYPHLFKEYNYINKFDNINSFILNVDKKKLFKSIYFKPQVNWIKNYKYNYIGRFENLQDDFYILCEKLNIEKIKLKKINETLNKKKAYQEYYNKKTRNIIKRLYEEDIKVLQYTF